EWLQRLAKLPHRAEDGVLRGIHLDAEGFSDLFDRHSFKVAQNESGALISAEALHGRGNLLAQLRADQQAVLLRFGSNHAVHLCVLRITAVVAIHPTAGSQEVERAVDGDAMQPRSEICALFEAVQLSVRAQERLLHHIVGIVLISGHSIRHSKNRLAMTLDEQPESV